MTAIEQFTAARKILQYARRLGFTDSSLVIDSPDDEVECLECLSVEEILQWMRYYAGYLNCGESEWLYLRIKLGGPTKLEIVYVDEFLEEMDKLDEESKKKIVAKINAGDEEEFDRVAPYWAMRFDPGGLTVKWEMDSQGGYRDKPIVPAELKAELRRIVKLSSKQELATKRE